MLTERSLNTLRRTVMGCNNALTVKMKDYDNENGTAMFA